METLSNSFAMSVVNSHLPGKSLMEVSIRITDASGYSWFLILYLSVMTTAPHDTLASQRSTVICGDIGAKK